MFWYNLKFAFRLLLKERIFSFITIFGLVIGLASFLILFLYVSNEKSFDKHIKDHERIYRVTSTPVGIDISPWARSLGFIYSVVSEFPEVELATQFSHCPSGMIKIDNHSYKQNDIMSVDRNFFKMFGIKSKLGDLSDIFNPNTVFITQDFADKYFINENPIGKNIEITALQYFNDVGSFEIRGIIENPHPRTHFSY